MSNENDQTNESENLSDEEKGNPELYDAVSAAIDAASDTKPEKKDDDVSTDADEGADTSADTEVQTGGDTAVAADDAETEESPEGGETDEDGAADDAAADAAEDGDGTAAATDKAGTAKDKSDVAPEKSDPVNDPIPESTNEKTASRIKSLIGLVKEKSGAEQQRDELVEEITRTGANPDQYAATLGFLKLYNSTDTNERKKALEFARTMVRDLSIELNEGASVVSLDEHDDLKADVEAGTLTEGRAREIAAGRERDKLANQRAEYARQQKETASQTQRNVQIGRDQLNQFERTIAASDPGYPSTRSTFINLLRPVLKRTHPTEWGAAAQEVYEQVKTLPAAAASKPKPKPKNQPLRTKGSGGGSNKESEASSAVAAMDRALENM